MRPVLILVALVGYACARAPVPSAQIEPAETSAVRVPPVPSLAPLGQAIRTRIAEENDAEIGLALIDLGTGQRLEFDASITMHAASTMKVPVMLELFRAAEAGGPTLDRAIPVTNQFHSIIGDTAFTLSIDDDSEKTLYDRLGERVSLRELARLMIVRSSNLALNLLIQQVGADAVMRTLASIGAQDMVVRRGVEDMPAFRQGLNNTTTAAAFAAVLEAIARCSVTLRAACGEMLDILADQEFDDMIPAGLPAGTRVAHKTGWISGIHHDGGIVFPPERAPYVLVILTRGITDAARASRAAADISRMVWTQLTDPAFDTWVEPEEESTRTLLELHARHRVTAISVRHFGYSQLWRGLEPFLDGAVRRETVGRSGEGRELSMLRYGTGPTRVLMWSQMHGDESTATMALADLVRFLHESGDDPRARRWAERITLLMIPMLNPDGAERFQRQDAYGVDVNRDGRALATPEAQTLKRVRDTYRPEFGFNLHDQNPRTRVGSTERLAAISLLAPAVDRNATETEGFLAAKHVAAIIARGIDPLVHGYVTRYDDTFNARAFGDLMQQWGTSTVLIESGGWRGDPEKQYLRAVNFVALVTALDAIANDNYRDAGIEPYEALPSNGRSVNDLLIRGGTLVIPGLAPVRADVTANLEDGNGAPPAARISEIGDLAETSARDTLDVPGLFLHPVFADTLRAPSVTPGMDASFDVRSGATPNSEIVFRIVRGVRTAANLQPPD